MAKAIVALECGCFFHGREFICEPTCEDHSDVETIEIVDRAPCDACGCECPIDDLDSLPTMTWWLQVIRFVRGQSFMLRYASDRGYDFDSLQCAACYGPGYEVAP